MVESLKVTEATTGDKEFRCEDDTEAYEFNRDLKEIDYFTWSERFQCWTKSNINQIKIDYPSTYQDLIDSLSLGLEKYDDLNSVVDWSTSWKMSSKYNESLK